MLRRSHKKSRAGCNECKRRHVKCDEQRPRCIICTLSERPCSYPSSSQSQPDQHPTPSRLSPPVSNTPVSTVSTGASPAVSVQHSPPRYPTLPDLPYEPSTPLPDAHVNLDHMALLIHFSVSDQIPDLDDDMSEMGSRLLYKSALEAPYLLYEMLAVSARRLSVLSPEKSETYLQLSVSLQTKAVSLFNETVATAAVDNCNCVPMMLFSAILNRHLLANLLARREQDLAVFLSHYTEYVGLGGGIKAITHSAWPVLLDSEMKDFLIWAACISRSTPVGNQCDPLRQLLSKAGGLDEPTKGACELAIHFLQVGFDIMLAKDVQNRRYMMPFAWSVIVPQDFTDLLEQRRPEALVILAYFGLLLHYSRHLWQIGGDSGSYIVTMIAQYLGPGWEDYISWPLSMIAADPV
ncbi:hypothetical protein B0T25DRAFT_3238 [Lasiosphaeria hispida]|uniref:Zn(2)-C6 fungal-type domain-containing protein n=1 Tax=Lasiosphaeria hispida TaxID=260671 RepID=A0AAJ0MJ55_9PEZI|nr:hypothetical protein B0T25DRAFT_3238 [Lasiosphaeria hispida]